MAEEHGSGTITTWLQDLVQLARSDEEFEVSAGAEPGRQYAYLEYHGPADNHSILVFRIEQTDAGPEMRTYRFDGQSEEVSDKVHALTHEEEVGG